MNWLQKIAHVKFASITFQIQDAHRIGQPKNLTEICWDIQSIVSDYYPKSWIINGSLDNTITPDAPQWKQMTGDINWYIPVNIDPQEIEPHIEAVVKDMSLMGIEISAGSPQKSNMMHPNAKKIVLTVYKNATEELERMPEINLSQGNAAIVLKMLQLFDSESRDTQLGPISFLTNPSGQIAAQELLRRIKRAYQNIDSSVRPPSQGIAKEDDPYEIETSYSHLEEQPGAKWFDPGLPKEQIERYLSELTELALKAISMQSNKEHPIMIVWN